jgi:hypothetical protein
MLRYLLIFTILLSAVSLGLVGTTVVAVAESDTRIVVVFVQPQHFTDMTYSKDFHTSGALLDELHKFMRETGEIYVPAGLQLEIKVLDVDLAGDFELWRGPQFDHVRIIRAIYSPRISLEFRLINGSGDLVSAGKRVLYDVAYQQRIVRPSDDYLRYEKDILRDWFRSEFSDINTSPARVHTGSTE